MGGDGQALQNKRSLLQKSRLYEKQSDLENEGNTEKQTDKERRAEQWTHCALSLDPLEFPLAFDLGGIIFSKQSVLMTLIERKKDPSSEENTAANAFDLRKLSDVREVENEMSTSHPVVRCPISGVSASSGLHKFFGFWSCGHVVSSSALPDPPKIPEQLECPVCGVESCVVPLVPDSLGESNAQRKQLRSFLRAKRKRGRDNTGD